MIGAANEQTPACDPLEMAPQAKVVVADREQLGINGPVSVMALRATLTERLVLEYIGTALRGVTAETALALT